MKQWIGIGIVFITTLLLSGCDSCELGQIKDGDRCVDDPTNEVFDGELYNRTYVGEGFEIYDYAGDLSFEDVEIVPLGFYDGREYFFEAEEIFNTFVVVKEGETKNITEAIDSGWFNVETLSTLPLSGLSSREYTCDADEIDTNSGCIDDPDTELILGALYDLQYKSFAYEIYVRQDITNIPEDDTLIFLGTYDDKNYMMTTQHHEYYKVKVDDQIMTLEEAFWDGVFTTHTMSVLFDLEYLDYVQLNPPSETD